MRFLLLNQTFHPDVASTAQHLTDLALGLINRGHQVTVISGQRAYDDPSRRFAASETWRQVRILRIRSTGFGKGAKWRRACDFGSFICFCGLRLAFVPKPDVVVALTSPPLISVLGALLAKLRGSRFFYWVMDFNPDEAIAAGWLRPGSIAANALGSMSLFSLRQASKIVVLDRFMQDRVVSKGIASSKVVVIPPWSHDDEVRFDAKGRDRFRKEHGLCDKFTVMYSGNHSPCHPLDTLTRAAELMKNDPSVAFCFVGGGSEFRRVKQFVCEKSLSNVICLPYRPLAELSESLSAADLHVVVMGEPFVGLVHPCKLYNILRVGSKILYIGPRPSHISESLDGAHDNVLWGQADHGQVEKVAQEILRLKGLNRNRQTDHSNVLVQSFSKTTLLPRMLEVIENVSP